MPARKFLAAPILLLLFSEKPAAQCWPGDTVTTISQTASVPSENVLTARPDRLGRPFVYLASKEGGLKVLSTSQVDPVQVAQMATSNWGGLHLMSLEQSGDTLFLALGNHFNLPKQPPGLAIVSVKNPAAPILLGTWTGSFAEGGAGAVEIGKGRVYLAAMFNGLILLDVKNPAQISQIGQFLPDLSWPHGVPPTKADSVKFNVRALGLRGDLLFTCFDRGGLRVLDVSDPAAPFEVGRYCNENMVGFATAYNDIVFDDNNVAYASVDYLGVESLDISDPAVIKRIGWWNAWGGKPTNNFFTWAGSDGHANELVLQKGCRLLHVATGKSDLFTINVADPADPQTCSNYGGTANGIGTYGLGGYDGDILYLTYIFTVLPFQSNWTGVKILFTTECVVGSEPEALPSEKVEIAPNPSDGRLGLAFGGLLDGPVEVEVFCTAGWLVFSKRIPAAEAGLAVETGLGPGIYFVRVQQKGRAAQVVKWAVVP